jgi:hypothetical protein
MCPPTNAQAATASLTVFSPDAKCCTYLPTLPNFLVGMILADEDPQAAAGRESVQQRIALGVGVTPLGIQAGPHFTLIYKHAADGLFGRSPGLRCPHFLAAGGGLCGIWRHRNAVCSTWFCKYERGDVGKKYWESMLHLLTMVERHLSLWAASSLGESVKDLGPALLPYYATVFEPTSSRWTGGRTGSPSEFYREAAKLVNELTWAQVQDIGGPELALLVGRLRAAHGALQRAEAPDRLRLGTVTTSSRPDGNVALMGYSPHDMLVVSASLAEALNRFDGRHWTSEVCKELENRPGVTIDHPTLVRLVDFGVLQPVPTPRPTGDDERQQV